MEWKNLIINVIAIFAGLFIYIGISYTKWGKKHSDMQFFIMLVSILSPVVIVGLIRHFVEMAGVNLWMILCVRHAII